jgi:soluble P-type ATPase
MKIEIPGYKTLEIRNLVMDYNGTVAIDGSIPEDIKEKLIKLSEEFNIYILTADTHGDAEKRCEGLPITIKTFPGECAANSKLDIVKNLGSGVCACIGNGRNDALMFMESELSIAVVGKEGIYAPLLAVADICVGCIGDGLDLFLKPARIIADLRG